ncbi:MAG: glycosyltransferase [Flavobacteriales bacterium]
MTAPSAPLVSVIVPNYNHAAFLRQRLDSILAQTVAGIELILLDDASTDDSVAILRTYAADPRVAHLVVNEHNSGSAFKQWRTGLSLARGQWIWIAESDDSCLPDLLERLLALNAREQDTLGLVYAQSAIIDEAGQHIGSMREHTACFTPDPFTQDIVEEGRAFIARYLKVKNVIPNASAVLFRRSLIADAHVWTGTEDMKLGGDWLLWVRLLRQTRIGFVSAELNQFRDHAGVTRKHTTTERKQQRILEEAIVRSALGQYPEVDQRGEEQVLYEAWFPYFTFKELFSSRLFRVRIKGRSRLSFLLRFLSFKWARFKERMERGAQA